MSGLVGSSGSSSGYGGTSLTSGGSHHLQLFDITSTSNATNTSNKYSAADFLTSKV